MISPILTNYPRIIGASAGKLTNTGNTSLNTLATVTIPGGSLGPNGFLRVWSLWSTIANTNTKTMVIQFGGVDVLNIAHTAATHRSLSQLHVIKNRNAQNAQVMPTFAFTGIGAQVNALVQTGAIDTTADQALTFRAQCNTVGTDTIDLEAWLVEVCYQP